MVGTIITLSGFIEGEINIIIQNILNVLVQTFF